MNQGPNCQNCRHYFVTWDPARPRGCRAHGFKSQETPSQVVFASSGMGCQLFEGKPKALAQARARAEDALNPRDRFERSS